MVQTGDKAPEFTLEGSQDGEIRTFTLSEFLEDGPPVLTFYIYDYSPVCTDQMYEVNDMECLARNDDATPVGVSTDGPDSHGQFAADNDISYPLLTDDDKEAYEPYGMVTVEDGKCQPRRGIVVVDTDRTVRDRRIVEDNWDTWEVAPLDEANKVVREVVDGPAA